MTKDCVFFCFRFEYVHTFGVFEHSQNCSMSTQTYVNTTWRGIAPLSLIVSKIRFSKNCFFFVAFEHAWFNYLWLEKVNYHCSASKDKFVFIIKSITKKSEYTVSFWKKYLYRFRYCKSNMEYKIDPCITQIKLKPTHTRMRVGIHHFENKETINSHFLLFIIFVLRIFSSISLYTFYVRAVFLFLRLITCTCASFFFNH